MKEISVKFRGIEEWATYTTAIWNLLVTDRDVEFIIDPITGELLFSR